MIRKRDSFGGVIDRVSPPESITGIKVFEPASIPKIDHKHFSRVTIVVPVYNSPHVTRPCLKSLHDRTPLGIRLIIVDDASDFYTQSMLREEAAKMMNDGRIVTILRNAENRKYTKTINRGFKQAFKQTSDKPAANWCISINSDTLATPGWLERLWEAVLSDDNITMICPYMSNGALLTVAMPHGASYITTAERLAVTAEKFVPDAVTPVGACMGVRRDVWQRYGPFDEEFSPDGYGEECDFWAKQHGKAAIGASSYFFHQGHVSYGPSAVKREKDAVDKFFARHRNVYNNRAQKARKSDPRARYEQRLPSIRVVSQRPRMAFFVKGVQLCGGMLALVNICNKLIERNIDATIAYELDDWGQWKLMPTTFAPINLKGVGISGWIKRSGFKEGLVFATAWATGDYIKRLCGSNTGLKPCAFIQDREDLFRLPGGGLQYERRSQYESYLEICDKRSIVNSNWVLDSMVRDFKIKPTKYIPIGIDPDLFYDRGMRGVNTDRVRILSFSRPTTPRRGFKLLAELYIALHEKYGKDIELMTYDESPGQGVPAIHLGRIPQSKLAVAQASSDILIEPSSSQGWGLPGQEMMSTGGCLISTNNGGIHNYGVHDQNCLIAEPTFDAMFTAICRAIDDRALRTRLGYNARKTITNFFSWDRIADGWASIIRKWAA